MSKHSVSAGDLAALLTRFSELRRKACARTGKSFPILVIQEAGLDERDKYRAKIGPAFVPERLVTDDLRSYGAAARALGLERMHERGRWRNNRPKIRISRPDDGSARCNVSRALALRRNFFQPTPPFTTLSTSSAISYQLNRTACSAPQR